MTLKLGVTYRVSTTFGTFNRLRFLMNHLPTWARRRADTLHVFEMPNGEWFEVQADQLVGAKEIDE